MKYAWAVPGQKVERVSGHDLHPEFAYPAKGRAYTIRDVFDCPRTGTLLLHLEGVNNPIVDFRGYSLEPGFAVEHFQPLISRSQSDDIAMFREIADRGLAQNGIHTSSPEPVA